jgi:hypothetical protein
MLDHSTLLNKCALCFDKAQDQETHPALGWCCVGPSSKAAAVHTSQLKQQASGTAVAAAAGRKFAL